MKNLSKNIVWAIITLIIIAFIFSFFYQEKPNKEISIDQLVSKIRSGEIAKITVQGNNLNIDFKNGEVLSAKKETEVGLTQTLKNYGLEDKEISGITLEIKDESGLNFWLGMLIPIVAPILVILLLFWLMFRQAKTGANQVFSFGRANIRLFANSKDRITFKDVAGLKEAKQELEEVVDFLKNPKKFLDIGARIPRGVLLMGPPGSGKTLLARAVAGQANVPFFHISGSEFVEMFVGVGASRVRDLFLTAKKSAPAIIFIDEIDAVGRERGAGLGGGHDEREQTLNQILVEMDGFDRDTKLIVTAATNRPDILDPALLRPGRFDRRIILDLPDINDREEILKIHAKDKPLANDVDLRKIAIRTPGFSGADLANLVNEAAILAARENKRLIEQKDILASIEKVILGPERKGRVISDQEKKITAYHEAGHALVASGVKGADPIHKISIISRGQVGGYTLKLPLEESRLRTRSQFMADLAILLGGYASEKIVFNELSTGASNDLKEVSELARRLVTRYGMSEKLGPITFGRAEEMVFLGREIAVEKDYSEEMAKEIDGEIKKFIDRGYQTAKKVIFAHRKALDAIAKTLIEKETLEQEEFANLLKRFKIKPITA